jgi:monoamine oxidase
MPFSTTQIFDAIVIGAGLSGLSAATQLANANKSVVVLEARDRVGGKTWTINYKDGTLDLGGAWVNENTQRSIVRYAREFGLELFPQNTEGDCLLQLEDGTARRYPYGEPWPIDQAGVEDLANVREIIEAQAAKINMRDPAALPDAENWDKLDIRTFCDKYAKSEWTKKTLELWSRIMFGVEPESMSVLYFFDYMHSGGSLAALRSDRSDGSQALRIKQGTQSISKGLAARLGSAVKLNSPVASVSYPSSMTEPCKVTTRDGTTYKCKRVICTVPTTLYKEIEWSPPLPPNKLKLVNNTEMGYYTKVSNATHRVGL